MLSVNKCHLVLTERTAQTKERMFQHSRSQLETLTPPPSTQAVLPWQAERLL